MTVVYYRRLDVNFSMCRYTNTILFSAWQHCVNEDSFIHDNTLSFTIFPGEINEMNLMYFFGEKNSLNITVCNGAQKQYGISTGH